MLGLFRSAGRDVLCQNKGNESRKSNDEKGKLLKYLFKEHMSEVRLFQYPILQSYFIFSLAALALT